MKDRLFIIFKIGLFLLASIPLFGSLLIFTSISLNSFKKFRFFLKDNWNISFFLVSILMIIISLFNSFHKPYLISQIGSKSSLTDLLNWLPFFWCFFASQDFLDTSQKRVSSIKFMIAGSIPVLISGILQYFFQIYGPFSTFYDLIIWFQKPITEGYYGMSGLFSNQNYNALWLGHLFPLILSLLYSTRNSPLKKITFFVITIIFIVCLIFTQSRNGWTSLILSFPLIFSYKLLYFLIPSLLLLGIIIYSTSTSLEMLNPIFRKIIPEIFYNKFQEIGFQNFSKLPRYDIWSKAIFLVKQRPILGWGATTFPSLYIFYNGIFPSTQHTHNIVLEIALSYGILTSLIFTITISLLIAKSWMKIYQINSINNRYYIFDKAWWASAFIIFLSHLTDLTFYDVRINLNSWIILAGLRCILNESKDSSNINTLES